MHALVLNPVAIARARDRAAELLAQDAANRLPHALLAFDPVGHGPSPAGECATIRARMAPNAAIDYSTTIGMWKFSQAGVVFSRFCG